MCQYYLPKSFSFFDKFHKSNYIANSVSKIQQVQMQLQMQIFAFANAFANANFCICTCRNFDTEFAPLTNAKEI